MSLASAVDSEGSTGRWPRKLAIVGAVATYALLQAPPSTQPAVADGDTRTLTFVNNHTNETGSFTYRVNGQYDEAVLEKLNWFMRDWRLNEQTKMDPKLFDILYEVYRQSGSSQPIDVLSGFRSPQTNAMLRHRSKLVAEHSQHMQGKAIDAHFMDLGPGVIRDVAMRMQEGGVGFYPIGATPWVHIDSGTVRYWPRMNRAALARLFPDGKTVFIPSDGQPMEGYNEAKAMIESRGGDVQVASASGGGNIFSWLFGGARGGGADDEEETGGAKVLESSRGGPMMTAGRGGIQPAVAAYAAPEATTAAPAPEPTPVAAAPPPPAPPPIETVSSDAAATVAEADPAEAPDAQPLAPTLDLAAPLPPRRPASLVADLDFIAPTPPRRPAETPLETAEAKPDGATNRDPIATLIEGYSLPTAITKGVSTPPKSALSLAEPAPKPGGDPNALARATALTPPPLPPSRPRLDKDGVTSVEKSARAPAPHANKNAHPSASNPYGSLVLDAFNTPVSAEDAAK